MPFSTLQLTILNKIRILISKECITLKNFFWKIVQLQFMIIYVYVSGERKKLVWQ